MKLILFAVLLALTEADPKTYLVKTKDHQDHQDYVRGPLLKGPLLPPHRGGEKDHCDEDFQCFDDEECVNNKCVDLVPFDVPVGGECRKDRQCLDEYPCVNGKCEQPRNRTCEIDSSGYHLGCSWLEECVNNICIQLAPLDVPIGGECRTFKQCLFVGEKDDKMDCVHNKCQIYVKKPNGKECDMYSDCVSHHCVNEVCQPKGFCVERYHCKYDEECIEGKCKKSDKAQPGHKCTKHGDCINNDCYNGRCYINYIQKWML